MPTDQYEKAVAFRALHTGEPFVIPNPWDVGSAKVMEALGFKALATTSSGLAFTLGRLDGGVTFDELLVHVRALNAASTLPISVDLENGYGSQPDSGARAVVEAAAAGAVGGSIEDWDPDTGLYPLDIAVERVTAAVEAAAGLGFPFTLTARAENHIRGNPDLDDTIARLQAYEAAGANVLYAPGLSTVAEIRSICAAVRTPVNVLADPSLSVGDVVAAGAQRISVGGSLAWAAIEAMAGAAIEIRDTGSFGSLRSSHQIRGWLTD
jgi:2-methylisocitrate lyase-like PEP mutase family enzyme